MKKCPAVDARVEVAVWSGGSTSVALNAAGPSSSRSTAWKPRVGAAWLEELPLGVKVRDLPQSAELHVRLLPSCLEATLPLFTCKGRRLRSGSYRLHLRRDSRRRFEELDRCERVLRRVRRGAEQQGSTWLEQRVLETLETVRAQEAAETDGLVVVLELPKHELPVLFNDACVAVTPGNEELGEEDADMMPGPAELKARKLARSVMNDPRSKPDGAEREAIAAVLRRPPARQLSGAEAQLLWRFRNALTTEPRALPKFLRAVDWSDANEAKEACALAEKWAPMRAGDALELLGPSFSGASVSRVRSLAVTTLESSMEDDELRCYLLQLVAALRYEPLPVASGPLASMLVRRATRSASIACLLHWYLLVECDDPVHGSRFDAVHERLVESHCFDAAGVEGEMVLDGIRLSAELMSQLNAIMRGLKAARGGTKSKAERLKALLAPGGAFAELAELGDPGPPCPLDPGVRLNGLIAEKSAVFKSALHPLKLAFRTSDGGIYTAIYKRGDDLRQDQLVVAMIALMDRLLKRENLDLQLTPYSVTATGSSEGLVEFVPSTPLSEVLERHRSIPRFLASHSPDENGPMGVAQDVHEALLRSCAGSCVVTYILGVGDRHLDNLMLTPRGRLFHIDFGYIMGRDPKPFAPPVKLCREMVEAMGGVDSPGYARFRSYCCEAFNILRKSSNLILNLIMLMSEANIPDISTDPERTRLKLQEKLVPDASDEEAIQLFQGVLNESATALFPNLVETAHRFAMYWR